MIIMVNDDQIVVTGETEPIVRALMDKVNEQQRKIEELEAVIRLFEQAAIATAAREKIGEGK